MIDGFLECLYFDEPIDFQHKKFEKILERCEGRFSCT